MCSRLRGGLVVAERLPNDLETLDKVGHGTKSKTWEVGVGGGVDGG